MRFSLETIEATKELKIAFDEFMNCIISDMQEFNDEDCEEKTDWSCYSFDDPPF